MSTNLTEEEMRQALFGSLSKAAASQNPAPVPFAGKDELNPMRSIRSKALSPKLRVVLHVTKEFEGDLEVFTYDANTLSTLVAEQEAKDAARKKRFKYFEVVSVKPI
ncbi:hypothetical protein [Pseudomonas fluorescens]|uniref:hypothetical protein n=1 Tax=Pseudomonas fluorescens TaxID=294 RepID=UPI001A9FB099|nr:hypothetical protein [Pseudomonas fluorescens]QTD31718.1 hypothetical protein JZM58_20815 [Pseudomonas fluorescens]